MLCHDFCVGATVLIVDDHAWFRSLARALLEAEGFDVVAEAGDGTSALAVFAELRPSIVVLDVQLPDLDGFAVAERHEPPPAIVLVSTREASSCLIARPFPGSKLTPSSAPRRPGQRLHSQTPTTCFDGP